MAETSKSKMFKPLPGGAERSRRSPRRLEPGWEVIAPVPGDAPAAPTEHPTRGTPSATWAYRDRDGALLGHVCRFDGPQGAKDIIPLTYCHHAGHGRSEWRWRSWPTPRPLYRLHDLAARSEAPVVVCEGEKAADAAAEMLPDFVAVTSPNGSKAAGKSDWTPLAHRAVTIGPDNDTAGAEYAAAAARALATVSTTVSIIAPPTVVTAGWDAADALADGWDTARALALIETATPAASLSGEALRGTHGASTPSAGDGSAVKEKPTKGKRGKGGRSTGDGGDGPPVRSKLVKLTDACELWHNPSREPFASIPMHGPAGEHVEHWPVRSRDFRWWLVGQFYDAGGGAPSSNALDEALRLIETLAVRGPEFETFIRIGKHGGAVYLDLGNYDWRAVEITKQGWNVVARPPVKFLRNSAMRALPEPARGESIDALRPFLNVETEGDFKLCVGWLIGALWPDGPYPLLALHGEQGSAKSTAAGFLRDLVDPREGGLRALPRDERDLAVAADNSWILGYDNLSGIAGWLSDALCRLSTGGGFATRELHSDRGETVFAARRPIIINGITNLAERGDLADRVTVVNLRPIMPEDRRAESELRAEFERARPEVLGALLDGIASVLAHRDETKLDQLERMADHVLTVTAAEAGLGWPAKAYASAYTAQRTRGREVLIENDPVVVAIREIMEHRDELKGPASELLPLIEDKVSEKIKTARGWPGTPAKMGKALMRAAPLLRSLGFDVEHYHSGGKMWIIKRRSPREK